MKYVLIYKNDERIHEVASTKEDCFDVHEDFSWIPVSTELPISRDTYTFNKTTGILTPIEKVRTHYSVARGIGYGSVAEQMDGLYHWLLNGDGSAEEYWAKWQADINKVKILFPKDNDDATNAAHDEVLDRFDSYMKECERSGTNPQKTQREFMLELAQEYIDGIWNNPVTGQYIA